MEPVVERDGRHRDADERDRERPEVLAQPRGESAVDGSPRRLPQGQRDPVQDAERGQRGDDRRDLESPGQAGVDRSQDEPAAEDRRDAEQDLGGARLGTDQEGRDHDAERDHRSHREVEVPDEERVRLPHRYHGQRHGEEEDGVDVRPVDEARGTASWCTTRRRRSAGAAAPPASTDGSGRSCATCSCRGRRGSPCGSRAWWSRDVRSRRVLRGRAPWHGHTEE